MKYNKMLRQFIGLSVVLASLSGCDIQGGAQSSGSGTSSSTNSSSQSVQSASVAQGTSAYVNQLYTSFLARSPSSAETTYYTGLATQGTSCAQIAGDVLSSSEFISDLANLSNQSYITELYIGLLGRNPSATEVNYYINLIDGGDSLETITGFFLSSQEFNTDCADDYGFTAAGTYTLSSSI